MWLKPFLVFVCVCDVVFRLEQKKQNKNNTTYLVDPLCKVCSASHPWNRIEDTSGATHICSYTYLEQHISGATHGFVFGLPRPTPPHCYNCTLEYCCRLDVLSFFSDTHSLNKLSSTIVGKLRRLKGHCLSNKNAHGYNHLASPYLHTCESPHFHTGGVA